MEADRHLLTENIFIHHPRMRQVQRMMERCRTWSQGAKEPYCLLVIGPTGVGKTTLIKDYLKSNPRVDNEETTIIPVVDAVIPVPATMKGMAVELLTKLGDPMAQRGTLNQQTWRLRKLLQTCGVQLIVLDEFNHFIDRDNDKVLRTVADWLKVLIDTTGVPVVLVGTPNSRSVLDANEQLRRRFGTQEKLEAFRWEGDGRDHFRRFPGARSPEWPHLAGRHLRRLSFHRLGFADLVGEVLAGTITVRARLAGKEGLVACLFSEDEVLALVRRHQVARGDALTIPEAADRLQMKQQVAYQLVKAGL